VVLIVDVDPETHLVAEGALPETECVIVGSRSAEMGLKFAERWPPSVLVVDANLGGLGYLTERLRRHSPHLHVVLLLAHDQAIDTALPRQAAGGTVLRKPVDAARLRGTLRTVLRLSKMSAGVKRMHGVGPAPAAPPEPGVRTTPVPEPAARTTPIPRAGAGRDK
jgi:DNA-binding response OmpR family regulator